MILGTPKAQRKAFQVRWKKQSGITGYQVQYSTDKKFRKNATGSKTLRNAKLTKLTVKKLKPRKTYYIRIRTYKTVKRTNYFSSWSKIAKVKTKR